MQNHDKKVQLTFLAIFGLLYNIYIFKIVGGGNTADLYHHFKTSVASYLLVLKHLAVGKNGRKEDRLSTDIF